MKIRSQKDFFSGLMFTIVGIAFAVGATHYKLGSAARMGPGYFPLMLGVILAMLGVVIIFKAMTVPSETGDKIGKWAWKPLGYVLGANVLFGLLLGGLPGVGLPAMGLIAAIYGLTFVSSMASERFKFREVLILSTILALISYLAFVQLLDLQFQVWPSFITG